MATILKPSNRFRDFLAAQSVATQMMQLAIVGGASSQSTNQVNTSQAVCGIGSCHKTHK